MAFSDVDKNSEEPANFFEHSILLKMFTLHVQIIYDM